jgi:hypothetical protein
MKTKDETIIMVDYYIVLNSETEFGSRFYLNKYSARGAAKMKGLDCYYKRTYKRINGYNDAENATHTAISIL